MPSNHAELPFIAYSGNEPFLFVSYSHVDSEAVYEELRWLNGQGANIWYDEGISPGQTWPRELAGTLSRCSLVVIFISRHTVESANCLREVHFAVERDKPILAVHLDDVELPDDWQFTIGDRQAILKGRLSTSMYHEKLLAAIRGFVPVEAFAEVSKPPVPAEPMIETSPAPGRRKRFSVRWAGAVIALVISAALAYWYMARAGDQQWLEQQALPALLERIDQDQYGNAYLIALEIEERLGTHAVPSDVWSELTVAVDVDTSPPGAMASYRAYENPESELKPIGLTPVMDVRLPRGELNFLFEKDGFAPESLAIQVPGPLVYDDSNAPTPGFVNGFFAGKPPRIELTETEVVPDEMVAVNASASPLTAFDSIKPVETTKFLIDRYETTNAQYQEFVDAGGYANPEFWKALVFVDDDMTLNWQEAMSRFKDTTGRAGPANWALGRFPDGAANLPVYGISWYEAMAYTRFRNKTLPPFHYWIRATVALAGAIYPITPAMVTQSNFTGQLLEVGSSNGLGPYGTYDTAGNVAEWIYNASGNNRMVMGGSAKEPPYIFYNRNQSSPWDRNSLIGIRGFRSLEPVDPELLADLPASIATEPAIPMSEEAFENDVNSYDYVAFESDPRVESESSIENGNYRLLSLRTGRGEERFKVHLYLPEHVQPPYQGLVLMGGADSRNPGNRLQPEGHPLYGALIQQGLRAGRAVIWPEWYGSYERFAGFPPTSGSQQSAFWRDNNLNWRKEADSITRYLESSGEFDGNFAWYGFSFGAIYAAPRMLYLLPQIKAAILMVGGHRLLDSNDMSYVRHVTKPVLMLNGRYDMVVPTWLTERLFQSLGTPEQDKKLVTYDMGHTAPPPNQMAREIDDWLNRYLGPVQQ